MSDCVRETPCTRCVHLKVCKFKDDFLDAYNAVLEASVNRTPPDGKGIMSKKVVNFDFISDISILCRYHEQRLL